MAFKTFGSVLYPPLVVLDRDDPIDAECLQHLMDQRVTASILIRSEKGAEKRGGFFFHLEIQEGAYLFHSFGGDSIIKLPLDDALRLINHSTGRRYDEEMLTLFQRVVNLRQDD